MKTLQMFLTLLLISTSYTQNIPFYSRAGTVNAFTKVDPPKIFFENQRLGKQPTATIIITYDNNFPTGDIRTAFQYAANIWANIINSQQPIRIQAKWSSSLPSGALAAAGATAFIWYQGFFYPISLAEKIKSQNEISNFFRHWRIAICHFNKMKLII